MDDGGFQPDARLGELITSVAQLARERNAEAYVVGGTVRDVLLRRAVRDLDIAVSRGALDFARVLADRLDGHYVPLDDEHAVARVVVDREELRYIDVAQMQGALDDDLRRRDFTIDALAVVTDGTELIDAMGGLSDLRQGVVRMGSPAAFDADPLRLLRGARIAAELRFEIDAATAEAMRRRATLLSAAAAERRRDELARILSLSNAGEGVRLLDRLGLLDVLLPELASGRGCTQPENHHSFDVLEHNVRTVEAMDSMLMPAAESVGIPWLREELWRAFASWQPAIHEYLIGELSEGRSRRALLKLAGLLHDVAKPQMRTVEAEGRIRFFGHADAGADIASTVMRRLRFSSREIAFVSLLVAEHMRPVQLAQVGEAPTRRALYRFHRDVGVALPALLLLVLADAHATRGENMSRDAWSRQAAYMNGLLVRLSEEEGIVHAPRLLSGHDIIAELDLAEGPLIGRLLEAVREAQATGQVRDRESALAFARAQLVRHKGGAGDL